MDSSLPTGSDLIMLEAFRNYMKERGLTKTLQTFENEVRNEKGTSLFSLLGGGGVGHFLAEKKMHDATIMEGLQSVLSAAKRTSGTQEDTNALNMTSIVSNNDKDSTSSSEGDDDDDEGSSDDEEDDTFASPRCSVENDIENNHHSHEDEAKTLSLSFINPSNTINSSSNPGITNISHNNIHYSSALLSSTSSSSSTSASSVHSTGVSTTNNSTLYEASTITSTNHSNNSNSPDDDDEAMNALLDVSHVQLDSDGLYHCPIAGCSSTFTLRTNLRRHMRSHAGLKKHACQVCGKTFSRADDRNQHALIHLEEKPHQCDFCSKRFMRIADLRTHRKNHHEHLLHHHGSNNGSSNGKLVASASSTTSVNHHHIHHHIHQAPHIVQEPPTKMARSDTSSSMVPVMHMMNNSNVKNEYSSLPSAASIGSNSASLAVGSKRGRKKKEHKLDEEYLVTASNNNTNPYARTHSHNNSGGVTVPARIPSPHVPPVPGMMLNSNNNNHYASLGSTNVPSFPLSSSSLRSLSPTNLPIFRNSVPPSSISSLSTNNAASSMNGSNNKSNMYLSSSLLSANINASHNNHHHHQSSMHSQHEHNRNCGHLPVIADGKLSYLLVDGYLDVPGLPIPIPLPESIHNPAICNVEHEIHNPVPINPTLGTFPITTATIVSTPVHRPLGGGPPVMSNTISLSTSHGSSSTGSSSTRTTVPGNGSTVVPSTSIFSSMPNSKGGNISSSTTSTINNNSDSFVQNSISSNFPRSSSFTLPNNSSSNILSLDFPAVPGSPLRSSTGNGTFPQPPMGNKDLQLNRHDSLLSSILISPSSFTGNGFTGSNASSSANSSSSATTTAACCHTADHVHGSGCGHHRVRHGNHWDFLVDGHLHHLHQSHCDNHGELRILEKDADLSVFDNISFFE